MLERRVHSVSFLPSFCLSRCGRWKLGVNKQAGGRRWLPLSLCHWASESGAKNHIRGLISRQLRLGSLCCVDGKELKTSWLEKALQTWSLGSLCVIFSDLLTALIIFDWMTDIVFYIIGYVIGLYSYNLFFSINILKL